VIVLAFDCALEALSVAIVDQRQVLAETVEPPARDQAERLMPAIEATRLAAGLAWTAIDRLAVTTGPGGFTGVRVGIAAARGLALATGKPAIGLTTFAALAAGAPASTAVAVALEAGRGEIYLQCFDGERRPLTQPAVVRPEAAVLPAGCVPIGPASRLLGGTGEPRRVDAATLARLALAAVPSQSPPAPFYLRAPAVTWSAAHHG